MRYHLKFAAFLAASFAIAGCGATPAATADADAAVAADAADTAATADSTASADGATAGDAKANASPYDKFYNITSLAYDGDFVVIRTTDLPDHKSPFYGAASPKYEAYNGTNAAFSTAINLKGQVSDPILAAQDVTLKFPKDPKVSATHPATGFGAIGVALNGVVIYNQYNGVGALLGSLEINNLDQYNGHPTPAPALQYHYHTEPLFLTKTYGSDALLGYLLDGFPVYGPVEGGKRLKSADLDTYHGHTSATADYPAGIFHYHVTDDAPWINGGAYYGTPGTATH